MTCPPRGRYVLHNDSPPGAKLSLGTPKATHVEPTDLQFIEDVLDWNRAVGIST